MLGRTSSAQDGVSPSPHDPTPLGVQGRTGLNGTLRILNQRNQLAKT